MARVKGPAALLVVCACLAVLHTWPLAAAPHRYSRIDNGDFQLNAWAIAWVAHQVPRDPGHLFDANIFWPERRTLAYSEAMIVQGLMATPLIALGASPVLAFNLVMLAGFTLTAFAFGWLARRWTGSWTAAYVAASAAGFNAHPFTRLAHLQAMHVEFIAVVLLGMDLVFTRQRVRDGILLGAGFALQGLTSVYLMVFTTWAAIFAAAARWLTAARGHEAQGRGSPDARRRRGRDSLEFLPARLRARESGTGVRTSGRRQPGLRGLVHRLPEHGVPPALLVEPAVRRGQRLDQLPRDHRVPSRAGRRDPPGHAPRSARDA